MDVISADFITLAGIQMMRNDANIPPPPSVFSSSKQLNITQSFSNKYRERERESKWSF